MIRKMLCTCPDGRILGKMVHTDRYSPHVLQNIPGNMDQKLFAFGVHYFK
jgi:phosphoribosylformylglycinamidine synthase